MPVPNTQLLMVETGIGPRKPGLYPLGSETEGEKGVLVSEQPGGAHSWREPKDLGSEGH